MLPLLKTNVFVIIPVFNEEKDKLQNLATQLSEHYQVILVDDGSINPVQHPADSSIHILRHEVNLGQGAALQTGLEFALQKGAAYMVTFDADGQHRKEDIPLLLEPLLNNDADITLASRFLRPGLHNASLFRQLILKTGCYINYLFSGLYLSDAHNGLRGITRWAAEKLDIKENRMAHATELLFIIRKKKLRLKEVPATIVYTDYSKRKGQSLFNSVRIFFDLVLHKLFE